MVEGWRMPSPRPSLIGWEWVAARPGEGKWLVFNEFRDGWDEKRSFRRENPSLREATPEVNAGGTEGREAMPEVNGGVPELRESTPEVRPAGTELRRSRTELRAAGTEAVPGSPVESGIRGTANGATTDARLIFIK